MPAAQREPAFVLGGFVAAGVAQPGYAQAGVAPAGYAQAGVPVAQLRAMASEQFAEAPMEIGATADALLEDQRRRTGPPHSVPSR